MNSDQIDALFDNPYFIKKLDEYIAGLEVNVKVGLDGFTGDDTNALTSVRTHVKVNIDVRRDYELRTLTNGWDSSST